MQSSSSEDEQQPKKRKQNKKQDENFHTKLNSGSKKKKGAFIDWSIQYYIERGKFIKIIADGRAVGSSRDPREEARSICRIVKERKCEVAIPRAQNM